MKFHQEGGPLFLHILISKQPKIKSDIVQLEENRGIV